MASVKKDTKTGDLTPYTVTKNHGDKYEEFVSLFVLHQLSMHQAEILLVILRAHSDDTWILTFSKFFRRGSEHEGA